MKVTYKIAQKSSRGKNLTLVWGIHPFAKGQKILVALSAGGICWIGINCDEKRLAREWPGAELVHDAKLTEKPAREIAKRWPKGLDKLSVPLVLYGTDFQLKVWRALLKIESGKTATYEDIARKIGKPGAVRAVGSAVGKNTVSIVVPCHRVVNKNGGRVNYGWGAANKIALLKGEGVL